MKAMAQRYNVDLSHFFVAGDGMTDLPMIKLGGYTFAPSTSPQVLLEVCDMVIPSCEEDGMEKAFFVAIEKMLSSIEE
jgi:hydroxymethylpyrimidine pyrophosphatase-like HAD family hydrolase